VRLKQKTMFESLGKHPLCKLCVHIYGILRRKDNYLFVICLFWGKFLDI